MKIISLKVRKKECKDSCPIPLNLIPNVEKGIVEINYNEKTMMAKIKYDERLLSEDQIINKLIKIGYEVE